MKIAIVHSAFTEKGGAEKVIFSQALGLIARGHKVSCFASAIDEKRCFPEYLKKLKVKPYLLNFPIYKLRLSVALTATVCLAFIARRRLKDNDVVLCHHEPGPLIGYKAYKQYGIPYVCYIHHPPRFLYPRPIERMHGWGHHPDRRLLGVLGKAFDFMKHLDKEAIQGANALLANSVFTANEIKRIYGRTPIVCSPGADSFNQKSLDINEKRPSKLEASNSRLIITVARHTPHKKLEWALLIFRRILREIKDARLVILGGFHPILTRKLMALTEQLGLTEAVRFVDTPSEEVLDSFFEQAKVFMYACPNEDFGMGPVEAMARGVPVVAWNDAGGPTETVMHGVTGYIARPYKLEEFADYIKTLLLDEDLRRMLGENGRKHVLNRYVWKNHMDLLEDTLKQCVKQQHV